MIFLILLLGLALRLTSLNQSLWLDEAIEILAVKNNSFFSLITRYSLGDFHPPLYHAVLKSWDSIFGFSEVSSRFPSVIFGLLTVFFVYLIGKKLFGQRAGLIAALFMAANPLAVYYSQEARMYALAAFAVTAAFWFFLEQKWVWYAIFLAVALYTDYLPWFMLPVFFLMAKDRKLFFLSSFFSLLFVLPWLPFLYQQLHIGTSVAHSAPLWSQVVGGFDVKALPLTLVKFVFGRISLNNKIIYAVVFGPASAFFLWLAIRRAKKELVLWLLLPLLIGFGLSVFLPVYSYFRFLFVLPAFVLLLAAGAAQSYLSTASILIVSLAALAAFNLNANFQRENWRGAAAYVRQNPGLAVLPSIAQSSPLRYYGPALDIKDKDSLPAASLTKTVYLFRYVREIFDPQDFARKYLEANGYRLSGEKAFNGVLVWQYQK